MTGCGIPASLPFDAGQPPGGLGSGERLFFVLDGRLQSVARVGPGMREPVSRLRLLFAGPDEDETASGLSTALPAGLTVASASSDGTRLLLSLSGAASIPSLGLRQIACTAAEDDLFDVRITLGDRPLGTHSCPTDL
ncbi:hypothetical protein Ssi02_61950 [Sinosporangium siamense]|uniref:GerMN domain-containing protein n=2 Tax=Sinosporangium siamense TaxID=1367973 RepID=A0A919RPS9_9ACTN|nr:hypothetical protein Ssi02_61950 [Sinosporangium siamense]